MPKSIYQRLFENWPEPRLLLERNADGALRIARANDLACEYFGKAPGALDLKNINEFLDKENHAHVLRAIDVCIQSKLPLTVQIIPGVATGGVRVRSFYLNPMVENGEVVGLDLGARLPA